MKKIKPIILMLIITLSFLLGVCEIKALPKCDFDNYGTFEVRTQKEVNDNDSVKNSENNVVPNRFTSDDSAILFDSLGGWSTGERQFYHVYAMQGGYINTAKFTVYSDDETAQCEYSVNVKEYCEEVEGQTCETFKFMFNLNKKQIKKIVFDGTYYDANGNGPLNFTSNTLTVNKTGTDGAGVDHTTIPGKAIQEPIHKHIDSGSEKEEIESEVVTKTSASSSGSATNVNAACTSITDLFDEYWPIVMVITPILLIVMITIDFFKAMASGDADALRKTGTNTVKRTIAAVILLALPNLVSIIFDLFGIEICL